MSGIRSYDMSGDQIASLITALEGDEGAKTKWLGELRKWVNHRNRQLEILKLIEKWLTTYAIRTGVHIDWDTDVMDWVYYQMEYTSGIVWDDKTQKVIINKYASSRPLLNEEDTKALLDFVTEEICRRP